MLTVTDFGALGDGADDTAAMQRAYAAIPTTGGRLYFPPGRYCFNQPITITDKTAILEGCTASENNVGSHGAVTLEWTGNGIPISISGAAASGSALRGFRLNNVGTASVGIDINGTGGIALDAVALAEPAVPFTTAGVRIGQTTNCSNVFCDRLVVQSAAPIGLAIPLCSAHAVFSRCTIIGNTVNNIVLGTPTTTAIATRFIGSIFDIATNLDAVSIVRAQSVSFTDCYFEFGGTGHALHIPAIAALATGLDLSGCWFTCNVGSPALSAIRSDFSATIGQIRGSVLAGLANPGYVFQNGGCQSWLVESCHLNTSGSLIADAMTNVSGHANVYGGSGFPKTSLGGAGGSLAFYGAPPATQPVLPTGAGRTVDSVIATLQTLGLVKQQ